MKNVDFEMADEKPQNQHPQSGTAENNVDSNESNHNDAQSSNDTLLPAEVEHSDREPQWAKFDWELQKAEYLHDLRPFPDELFQGQLPELLCHCYGGYRDTFQRDVALFSVITFCSGIFPNTFARYGGATHHANLFFFLISPSSTGKSTMRVGEFLLKPIEDALTRRILIEKYPQYADRIHELDDMPEIMKQRLVIGANNSMTAFMEALAANNGIGILSSTEADIIGNVFKYKWGNLSAQWRSAWDHQRIDFIRKNVKVTIDWPRLTIAISGTPGQWKNIISTTEDGLHSRFLYYCYGGERKWKSPFRLGDIDTEKHFNRVGSEMLLPIWNNYYSEAPRFTLTEAQKTELNRRFHSLLEQTVALYPSQADSIIYRGGANLHRIAMVLTILRNPNPSDTIVCTDDDFESAFLIMRTLIQHGIFMTKVKPELRNPNAQKLLLMLPEGPIKTVDFHNFGTTLGFSESTIKRLIGELIQTEYIVQLKHGVYKKLKNAA